MVRSCGVGGSRGIPALAALGVWLAGCSGSSSDADPTGDTSSDPVDACTLGDITVAPGTGASAYLPLAEGDHVTMVHGPQGGWHIESAGLVGNATPEVAVHPVITVPEMGDLEVSGTQQGAFIALSGYDEASCTGNFFNVRAFLDTDRATGPSDIDFVCSLAGKTLAFSIEVSDISGARMSVGTVNVIADPDPADAATCSGG